jgi:predicted outer membrane repeat protein
MLHPRCKSLSAGLLSLLIVACGDDPPGSTVSSDRGGSSGSGGSAGKGSGATAGRGGSGEGGGAGEALDGGADAGGTASSEGGSGGDPAAQAGAGGEPSSGGAGGDDTGCSSGYTGALCDQCAAGYFEYPADSGTCVDDPCLPDPCNGHGSCDNSSNTAECSCSVGYNEPSSCSDCDIGYLEYPADSGTCVDDPCLPSPCNGHGSCDNSANTADCSCSAGYTDASSCADCDTGYFEYPASSGTCVDDPCLPDPCNGHGSCDNSANTADCGCSAGYTDALSCSECDTGYFEYPASSGTCVDDPCLPDPCNGRGTCSNSGNVAACDCSAGYTDASKCSACDAGYFEYPASSGTCIDDPCLPDPCNGHGSCDNAGNAATCTCSPGYTLASGCAECDTGYIEYPADSGTCIDDPCAPDPCNGHGACDDSGGVAACECATGYLDASLCGDCESGYFEYPASSGTCVDDPCLPGPCNGHGSCDNSANIADCSCSAGYTEASSCAECDTGYFEYPASSGTCVDDPCLPDPCNGRGTCSNSGNVAACDCSTGYTDASKCVACDTGYFEYPTSSGTCVDDPCLPDPCNGHGSCSNASNAAACTCSAGYTLASSCGECDTGYIEYPADSGTCIDDPCVPDACNGHGTCDSTTGTAACSCEDGYADAALCADCDTGYFEYPASSGTCVDDPCLPDACSAHGTCNNTSGASVCTCTAGFAELDCSRCVRYVDASATGTGTGLSWQNAFTNVQSAINAASTAVTGAVTSCDVWVADGTYWIYDTSAKSISLKINVPLYGGFTGSETKRVQRDPELNETILDGRSASDGTKHANWVVRSATTSSLIDGFTIREGQALFGGGDDKGGGLAHQMGSLTIANCSFEDNHANGVGGGMILEAFGGASTVTIVDTRFSGNHSNSSGGAIYISPGATVSVSGGSFEDNTTSNWGGAIHSGGTLTVDGATFFDNYAGTDGGAISMGAGALTNSSFIANRAASSGGGVRVQNSTVYCANLAFFGNYATFGGAMRVNSSTVEFINGTVTGNGAGSSGAGLYLGGTTATIANSIFSENTGTAITNDTSTVDVTYSDIDISIVGTGNIDSEPEFVSEPMSVEWAPSSGTTTTLNVANDVLYVVGDLIQFDPSFEYVLVTSSTAGVVTFEPPVSEAAEQYSLIINWGPDGSGELDLSLDEGSPCIDAADGDLAPASDLLGESRYDDPAVTNTGAGTVDYADMGIAERVP